MRKRWKFYLNWSIRYGVIRLESFDFNVGYPFRQKSGKNRFKVWDSKLARLTPFGHWSKLAKTDLKSVNPNRSNRAPKSRLKNGLRGYIIKIFEKRLCSQIELIICFYIKMTTLSSNSQSESFYSFYTPMLCFSI